MGEYYRPSNEVPKDSPGRDKNLSKNYEFIRNKELVPA